MNFDLLNHDIAKLRQADLMREATHSRLVADLSTPPYRTLLTLALRVARRCRAVVAGLETTKPVRRMVYSFLSIQG